MEAAYIYECLFFCVLVR